MHQKFIFCAPDCQINMIQHDRTYYSIQTTAAKSLRAWLAMPPFILIRALSCPAPRVMETQHKELDLGKLDSHPQRTIANPRQIAWNQQPNLLQHSNDCGQTTITSFPGRQPGADEHKRWRQELTSTDFAASSCCRSDPRPWAWHKDPRLTLEGSSGPTRRGTLVNICIYRGAFPTNG